MDKKVVLITGGSRGIGKAIALTLGKSDYHVIINYRSREDEAVKVLEEIIAGGGSGSIYQSDISNYNETEKMMTDIIKEYGGIDVLVNNAGITKDQLMLRMSEEDFSSVIDINLKGAFNCVKHVTRSMFKKRSGCIINISSVIGLVGNAGQVNYAASKAGIIGMTKALAKEYAARNIRVNAIAPGFIDTEMTDVLSEEIKEDILDKIPLHTLGRPEDIANMVNFLASDQAKYITGQVIAVDGGMTM
jgi:3-oxoacyl-[acyl-carrier protein] reductase